MKRNLLLGTAGHIDHGKTALIKALTGIETDRLPEEKRRGITVDLGFAVLKYDDLAIGIVDVPGHEGLIKNMLAGATGIDLALLVVAADESVMPQTQEHFQVLRLLGLSTGVIAITKCDLVDEKWLALVEEEVATLVSDSFLQDAPVVRVSAKTGAGLDDLRAALHAEAHHIATRDPDGPFRMAIDRSFSSSGHGAVVTGSVSSGSALVGDGLELMPQGISVQVRAIESHSQSVDMVGRSQRAALNLSGVHYRDIGRGQTLASVGSLQPSKLITVIFETSPDRELRLKSRTDVKFYAGTAEHVGQLRLLSTTDSNTRLAHYAQIELREDVCVVWNQPYILRGLSENVLLGGGWIVDPLAYRIKRSDTYRIQKIRELATGDEEQRMTAIAALAGSRNWDADTLSTRIGVVSGKVTADRLISAGVLRSFKCGNLRRLLHHEVNDFFESRLLNKLLEEHKSAPLQSYIPLGRLKRSFSYLDPPSLLEAIVQQLAEQNRVLYNTEGLAHPDWRGQLTAGQSEVSRAMITACLEAGLSPPNVGDFADHFSLKEDEIESLLQLAVDSEVLVRLPDKESRDRKAARRARIFLHRAEEQKLINRVRTLWALNEGWTVSEFREAFGLSRKYAVPLCEYLDKLGITERTGDRRRITPQDLHVT